ncbi:hypothetical protein Dform_00484 [Dehalogenimonas formicexedens]|uniref:Uncharacterized protein n=1 Tax=Dehalogenimonas formicexedens TaxID=1839801 RepID=A0A1P8F5T3_9CHLR|nr:hypothetical protein [Dehalogenimonas formicexedens]APV43839.1 hypothetical protein Dform_00484 [Dehalogenimonas formicexedens]
MKNTATVAVIIYTGLSLLAVGMFLIATISGDFSAVASIGGAVWVHPGDDHPDAGGHRRGQEKMNCVD